MKDEVRSLTRAHQNELSAVQRELTSELNAVQRESDALQKDVERQISDAVKAANQNRRAAETVDSDKVTAPREVEVEVIKEVESPALKAELQSLQDELKGLRREHTAEQKQLTSQLAEAQRDTDRQVSDATKAADAMQRTLTEESSALSRELEKERQSRLDAEYREVSGFNLFDDNYKATDAALHGMKNGLQPKDRKLTFSELHRQKCHMGHDPNCPVCKLLKKRHRRIRQVVDPVKPELGYQRGFDLISWKEESLNGNKYTLVMREYTSGVYKIKHLAVKSQVTEEEYPCENRDQLRQREEYHRKLIPREICLNMNRAFQTREDKRQVDMESRQRCKERYNAYQRK